MFLKKAKRARSENWIEEDKNLLKELIKERVKAIENKNTDTNTNERKKAAWISVLDSFNFMCKGGKRTLPQLKSQWGVLKFEAKKEKASKRRELNKTGGEPPVLPPKPSDSKDISSLLPKEFIVNEVDSDFTQNKIEKKHPVTDNHPSKSVGPVDEKGIQVIETIFIEEVSDEPPLVIEEKDMKLNDIDEENIQKKKKKININEHSQESISALVNCEMKCKEQLNALQIENENKRARNLDMEYEILKEKLLFIKKQNQKLDLHMD